MKTKKLRIWTGIGASLLAGAGTAALATPAPEQPFQAAAAKAKSDATAPAPALFAQRAEGGEGGEDGEGGEGGAISGLSTEAQIMTRLLAIMGHLRAGQDLFEAGDPRNARQHFAHPLSEEYEELEPLLARVGMAPFKAPLARLVDVAVESTDRKAVAAALAAAKQAVGENFDAAQKLSGASDAYPDALVAILRKAADEYSESMERGRFTEAVEYQDARGFILVARARIEASRDAFARKDAEAFDRLLNQVTRLADAVKTPIPPAKPVVGPSVVYGSVARAEIAINQLR